MPGDWSKRRVTWKINSSYSTDKVGNIRCWPISTSSDGAVPAQSLAWRLSSHYSFIGYLLESVESWSFTSASSWIFSSIMNTLCFHIWLSQSLGCKRPLTCQQVFGDGEAHAHAGMQQACLPGVTHQQWRIFIKLDKIKCRKIYPEGKQCMWNLLLFFFPFTSSVLVKSNI